jgi:hypothetical protein
MDFVLLFVSEMFTNRVSTVKMVGYLGHGLFPREIIHIAVSFFAINRDEFVLYLHNYLCS